MNKGLEKNKSVNILVAWVTALALFGACMAAAFFVVFNDHRKYRGALDNVYNNYAYTLYDSVNDLEVDLSKLMISSSKSQNLDLALDGYRQSEVAVTALSCLPASIDSEHTIKFLNQVGDFLKSFSHVTSLNRSGEKLLAQAETLHGGVSMLKDKIEVFMARVDAGERILGMKADLMPIEYDGSKTHNSVQYPELIYDGPFSDSNLPRHFKLLEGKADISLTQAQEKMSGSGLIGAVGMNLVGMSEGAESCYELTSGDGSVYASVTKRGGLIINYSRYRELGKAVIGEDQALAVAEKAAASLGYMVRPVWYVESEGAATVNLAPIINGVIYYPDLVKVKIALDSGEVLAIECGGYCRNFCERNYKPTMTAAAARSLVDGKLDIYETRLAVVPYGTGEVLCYEVAGEHNGLDYFMYFDAHNGETVKILRVVDTSQGRLTI